MLSSSSMFSQGRSIIFLIRRGGRRKESEFVTQLATSHMPQVSELCQLCLGIGTCVCSISHSFLLAVRRYYNCW